MESKSSIEKEYNGVITACANSRAAWRKWLEKNHTKEKAVWLIMYKMQSGTPSVYYKEAVEEALCFGWIDSKANKRDDKSYYQYFAQRNPKSKWSEINKDKIEELSQQGLMTAAGLAIIATAKQNGAWTALDEVEQIVMPTDLKKAFDKDKKAWKNFDAFRLEKDVCLLRIKLYFSNSKLLCRALLPKEKNGCRYNLKTS